jgi:hypothetical protein
LKDTLTFIILFNTPTETQNTSDEENEEQLKLNATPETEEGSSDEENEETRRQEEQRKRKKDLEEEESEDESSEGAQEDHIAQCRHDEVSTFKVIEQGYFKPNYLKKHDFAVRACANCKKNFGTTPSSTTFAVTANKTVLGCANACNSKNRCMYALCKPCHETQMNKLPSSAVQRVRKRKVITDN